MPDDPSILLLSVVIQDLVFLLLTVLLFWAGVFVARRFGRPAGYSLRALGLARPRGGLLAGAGLGLAVGFGALVASWVLVALSTLLLQGLDYPAENTAQEPLIDGVRELVGGRPEIAVPAVILVMVLFAPAVEELVFRGAVFGGLHRLGRLISRRLGGREGGSKEDPEEGSRAAGLASFVLASLLSSALFALLHLSPVILPALFVLSIALCALYERTGSLLPPFVAHATFNAFPTLLIILLGLGALEAPV